MADKMDRITPATTHSRAHRDERGAVALMSLASILIIVMLSMVLFDLAELGVEKTHLQTATDTSAYSQATIQARSMNMMAFANAGKRMTVGMANTYVTLYQWIHNIEHLAWYSDEASNLYVDSGEAICDQPDLATSGPNMVAFCNQIENVEFAEALSVRRGEGLAPGDATGAVEPFGGEFDPPYDPAVDGEMARSAIFKKGDRKVMKTFAGSGDGRFHSVLEWAVHISEVQEYTKDIHDNPPACETSTAGPDGATRLDADCFSDDDEHDIREGWSPGELIADFYGRDLLAYDNYQNYLSSMAPYWAWTEGIMRGMANAAPITVGYPMPEFSGIGDQDYVLELPVRRGSWNDTCTRAMDSRGVNQPIGRDAERQAGVESVLASNLASFGPGSGSQVAMALAIFASQEFDDLTDGSNPTHQVLARDWETKCTDATSELFRDASSTGISDVRQFGRPFLMDNYSDSTAHRWLMDSSNLMIGFRPNASRFDVGRDNYFVAGEPIYDHPGAEAGGVWAMARGEIAFQDSEAPNAWAPQWGARLRPVALPEEWSEHNDEGFYPHTAVNEMVANSSAPLFQDLTDNVVALDGSTNHLLMHNHGPSGGAAGDYLEQEWDGVEAMLRSLGTPTGQPESFMEGVAK